MATLLWWPPHCRWCAHMCHFHPGTICVWNINRPVASGLFVSLFCIQEFQDQQRGPLPCLMFNSETWKKKEKKIHKKVKVRYLYKSQQALQSHIMLLLVLGRSSLAFGTASGFKQRLSPLSVSLKHPLYSPPFTVCFASYHSAVTHVGHQRRRCPNVEYCFEGISRLNAHMFLHTTGNLQPVLVAAALRYGNYK